MVFNNEYRVMHIDGPLAGSREIFRPSSKGIPYTSNFNEEYSLKELEAAKNMALYLQKEEGIEHPLAEVELSEFSKNSPLFQELKELEN